MVEKFAEQHAVLPDSLEEIERLLTLVRRYMPLTEVNRVIEALHLAQETCKGVVGVRPIPPLQHALAISTILAQLMHADAVGIAAGLVFEPTCCPLKMWNVSLEHQQRVWWEVCRV